MLRPLQGMYEQYNYSLVNFPSQVQLSLKLKDKRDMKKVKENFRKIFFGLRTKCDGKSYLRREEPELISKLPDFIDNCQEAVDYVRLNFHPSTEALASLMYNDNIIVVNSHHCLCDGAYAEEAVKHCFDDEIKDQAEFPLSCMDIFMDNIMEICKDMPKDIYPNTSCTQIKCKGKDEPEKGGPNYILSEFDLSKLQCYDTKIKKPVDLTNSLWAATSLAMCTLENDFSNFCINTCFNMRSVIKNWSNKWNVCDQVSVPNINAKKHTNDMTLKELGDEFRKHFKYLSKGSNMLYPLNYRYDYTYPKGVFMNLSNLGPVNLDDRIDDIALQATHEGPGMETLFCYFTYSKISKNENKFRSRLRFPREAITAKKANILSHSINHLLVDVPLDTTIGEASAELRNLQSKLDKLYNNI